MRQRYLSSIGTLKRFERELGGVDRFSNLKYCPSEINTINLRVFVSDSKRDHCNKTVEIYEDVSSPPVTPENFGRPLTCTYRLGIL